MTKLVFLSDTHGLHDKVTVPAGDVLIHSGDCTNDIGQKSLRDFLIWFEQQPCPHKILVAGNHDGAFEKWPNLARAMVKEFSPSTWYLQDSGLTLKLEDRNIKFWGSPYQPEFFNWHFNLPRGPELKRHWDMIPDDTDVLITHGPPHGFLDLSAFGNEHCGCRDLKEALYRVEPDVHAFGHIHHGYGTATYVGDSGHKTTLLNASICNEKYQPVNHPWIFEL